MALLVAGCMVYPVVVLAARGITLTGMAEESIGYRYFYTLRMLYGDHERPWLPQGQLTGLSHHLLQVALTVAGYPPEQLFPRIDLFAYLASALPSLPTAAAFVYAVLPLRDARLQLLVGLLFLIVVFDARSGRAIHIIQGDYYTWVHPVALITIGMLLRAVNDRWSLNLRLGLGVGLFAAMAFTIKPTHLMFVAPVALLLLVEAARAHRWGEAALGSLAALASATLGVLLITWAYYLGDVRATYDYFGRLIAFIESVSTAMSFSEWLSIAFQFPQQPVNPLALGVLFVPLLAASVVVLPHRRVSFALLPGALLSVYLSWRRYYPNTLVETNDYTFVVLTVWLTVVLLPALRAWASRIPAQPMGSALLRRGPAVGFGIAVLLLGGHLFREISDARATALASFGTSSSGARELAAHLAQSPGRIAFLIPDGHHRPTTVDSAIAKGGTNISDPTWGVSPYVASLFPERDYYIGTPNGGPRVNLLAYDRMVFVSIPAFGGDTEAEQRLWEHFTVSLAGLDCSFRVDLRHHDVVVCEHRWRDLASTSARSAYYYAGDAAPLAGTPVELARGTVRALEVGDLVYWRQQGLRQIDAEHGPVSIRGAEGASVFVEGLGAWDPQQQTLAGLTATYRAGRWSIDPGQIAPSNTPPTLQPAGAPDQPATGWRLGPDAAPPRIEYRKDDGGPYVRLRPSAGQAGAILYTSDPLSQLDGAPVVLRATVRTHGATPATLTVFDVVAAPDRVRTQVKSTASFDAWETLEVRLDRTMFPYHGDNFSVAIYGANEADWVDIRDVSFLIGVTP